MTQSLPDLIRELREAEAKARKRKHDRYVMVGCDVIRRLCDTVMAMQWRDINTAPYDKTMVGLLHVNENYKRYGVGWYRPLQGWQGWVRSGDDYVPPTHWTPLPSPPTPDQERCEP